MQGNDQDDGLNNLPSFSLSNKERSSYIPSDDKKVSGSGKTKSKISSDENHKQNRHSRKIVVFLWLIIFSLIAYALWQYKNFTIQTQSSEQKINKMVLLMEKMGSKINDTGKQTTQNTSQFNKQMQTIVQTQQVLDKKLNQITAATDVNKKDISNLRWRNKLDNDKQKKDTSQIYALNKEQGKTNKQLQDLDKSTHNLSSQLKTLNTNQLSSTAILQSQLDALKKQNDALNKTVTQNVHGKKVDKKLESFDDALKSMDSYRLQINRRLLQLENSVRGLQQNKK